MASHPDGRSAFSNRGRSIMSILQTRSGWLLISLGIMAFSLTMFASAQEHTKDSLDAVKKAIAAKKAVLIDVREKSEWDDGHLRDAALLPLSRLKKDALPKNLQDILPKDKVVYLHCKAGGRCLQAAE